MKHFLLILLASAGAAQADVSIDPDSQGGPQYQKVMPPPLLAKLKADALVLCYLPNCMPMQMRRVDDWPTAAEISNPQPRQRDMRHASDIARLFTPVPVHDTLQQSATN